MDYKELIEHYRSFANRWENGEQLFLNGELRLQDALRDVATVIETLLAEREAAGWIRVEDEKPPVETEVFVLARHGDMCIMTTAIYEDGTVHEDDSIWNWEDLNFDYDVETDQYIIPEGWWEYRHYNLSDVYNECIDDVVTHWMPLPQLPCKTKEETT